MPLFLELFNLILKTGILPEKRTTGIIIPIYENKSDKDNPDNYRGITLLSCFGKLFTSFINRRVSMYLEEYDLIGEKQAGFRSGYNTLDHIFSLKCITDIDLSKNKRLFTVFISLLTFVRLLIIFRDFVYGGNFFSIILMWTCLMSFLTCIIRSNIVVK